MTPSPHPLPQGGEGFIVLSPLPMGEGWVRALFKMPLTPAGPKGVLGEKKAAPSDAAPLLTSPINPNP